MHYWKQTQDERRESAADELRAALARERKRGAMLELRNAALEAALRQSYKMAVTGPRRES